MNHSIVTATYEHVEQLVPRLRAADLREIAAATGSDPEVALAVSVGSSAASWAWLYRGRVMALFGVAPYPGRPGVGIPWLLGAKGMDKHKVYFIRQSRKYVAQMLEHFPVLENWVDCRNTSSIQWLAWIGFALSEVRPFFGIQRLPFIRFTLAKEPAHV